MLKSGSFRTLARDAIRGFGVVAGVAMIPVAWLFCRKSDDPIAQAVGQMLMLGFYGRSRLSLWAQILAYQVGAGQVGGVFFVRQNIGTRQQAAGLVSLFRDSGAKPLIAIDHEGGVVQRLTTSHGFTALPSARKIAETCTPKQAERLYAQAGRELAAFGINVNLGPVVDLDEPENPAIGLFERSYGRDPKTIAAFATAFVDGFAEAGLSCVIKHFPGHGRSREDSHDGTADISDVWTDGELDPFRYMIENGRARMIMGGHLRIRELEPRSIPTSISKAITTELLRERLKFTGIALTDDLDMGSVSKMFNRRQSVVRAIASGNDILMIKNLFRYDPLLPRRVLSWVRAAIDSGEISQQQILDAAQKIVSTKGSCPAVGNVSAVGEGAPTIHVPSEGHTN